MANSAKSARSELLLAVALGVLRALGICAVGACTFGANAMLAEPPAQIACPRSISTPSRSSRITDGSCDAWSTWVLVLKKSVGLKPSATP